MKLLQSKTLYQRVALLIDNHTIEEAAEKLKVSEKVVAECYQKMKSL